MKIFKFFVTFLLFLSITTFAQQNKYISFDSQESFRQFLQWKPGQYPILSAHRGGPMDGFPENCIATFNNAIKYQPLIIEFDVALSKDSVLVVMHDDKLDRTSTGTGQIGSYTYSELQKLTLKDNKGTVTSYKIPTLDEVLKWAKGKVILTIDVKRGVPFSKIVEAVKRTQAENYSIVITYNANQAAEVHQLAPDLMISVSANKPEDIARLNALKVPNNRMVAFMGTTEPSKENFDYMHNLGISTMVGTMGNIDRSAVANSNSKVYSKIISNGANMLSTDNLILAGEQLDAFRFEQKLKNKNIK